MTDLDQLRTLPTEQAAQIADYRLREIERDSKLTFTEIGEICIISERRELWKSVRKADGTPCTSWTNWIQDCLPCSASSAFDARDVAVKLARIPVDQRVQMPRNTLKLLFKLSPAVVDDQVVQRNARLLKPEAFEEFIEKHYPNQHIETRVVMHFRPERTAKERIEIALETAMEINGISTREEALLCICEEYLQDVEVISAAQTASD